MPSLVADYRLLPGVPDEMIDATGAIRPGWDRLMSAFEALGSVELESRFERADQYLRDAGVFYRTYDGESGNERAWPLAHIPLLISETDWQTISSGLVQRADLLEQIVKDIYGANQLVADGLLPPELIAQNEEFLRPLVGVQPVGGHFLHFCAFELGRGPDGAWWVLGDRTQAPSGAGFALENRVANIRALSDVYGRLNVHRLAGFFRDFRDQLISRGDDTGVAILSPGQLNETYFEHAYIARYLGLMLLEGEDLVVEGKKVMVRTVSGLKSVSVLWRRLDASFVDPLELRYDSRIGTAGLVEAVRSGALSLVNALGTGILETRAFSAFMPRLCSKLLGADLQLSGVATWWCGQRAEREYVLDNFDSLMIGPAFATTLPLDDQHGTALGASMNPAQKADLKDRIARRGTDYVGQEAVGLSTSPVYDQGRLVPRPITLRVFAARTENGWSLMPGGFARVGSTAESAALAMQRGGKAADVWVLSSAPVEPVSLLTLQDENMVRASAGDLPSRAADNLMWLGRYAERCEATIRILRAYHARLAELSDPDLPLLTHCATYLGTMGIDVNEPMPQGLIRTLGSAIQSAGQIRDRFSPDGWLALNDLQKTALRFAARLDSGDDTTRAMTVLLRKLAGFSGLVHENMYRFMGWRFLEIGRRIERTIQIARVTGWLTSEDAPDGSIELLLEIGDSVMSYRRRYSVIAGPISAIDILVLDPLNPRSALFQLAELRAQLETLPGGLVDGHSAGLAEVCRALETRLQATAPSAMTSFDLGAIAIEAAELATQINADYCT